jgi:hypothetical protein
MGGTAATSRTSSSRSAMMAAAMQQLHCTLLHCGSYRAAAFLPAGMAEGSSSGHSSHASHTCAHRMRRDTIRVPGPKDPAAAGSRPRPASACLQQRPLIAFDAWLLALGR